MCMHVRARVACVTNLQNEDNENEYKFTQEMTNREYLEDQDAEEPDDYIISLTTQVCL